MKQWKIDVADEIARRAEDLRIVRLKDAAEAVGVERISCRTNDIDEICHLVAARRDDVKPVILTNGDGSYSKWENLCFVTRGTTFDNGDGTETII